MQKKLLYAEEIPIPYDQMKLKQPKHSHLTQKAGFKESKEHFLNSYANSSEINKQIRRLMKNQSQSRFQRAPSE